MRLACFPLTDLGNAERFRERYKDRLLWCPAIGWLSWDGRRWSREGAEELVKIAEHDTVRLIQEEAKELRASGVKDKPDAPRGARDFVFKTDRDGNETLYSDKVAAYLALGSRHGVHRTREHRGAYARQPITLQPVGCRQAIAALR